MSQLTTTPETFSPTRRALLELLLKEKNAVASASDRIPRRPPSRETPLSFGQQQMWFLDQFAPGSSHYNFPLAFRFKGKLNLAALDRTLNEIVRRHEILRTTYDVREGTPVQIVHDAPAPHPPIIDLRSFDAEEREELTNRMRLEEGRRPFDLKAGPVMRTQMLCLAEDDHVLLLTMHHICTDGWSLGVFYREMTALYEAFSEGRPSPIAELPIQYADYAVWQRRQMQGEAIEKSLSFWRRQLKDAAVSLELPTDKPRPAAQTYNGAVHPFSLPQGLTRALRAFSRGEEATLFTTMLAAFKALLYRYTGQNDLLVGIPVANRVRPEIEDLLGFFINTFVLRTRVSGDESFRSFMTRVRETMLSAYDHQHLPIEKLMEDLQPERRMSHNPLFQVMFNFMFSKPAGTLRGLTLSIEEVDNHTAKFDLELNLWEDAGELSGSFEYNVDLFEAETISRLAANFQCLISAAVTSPETPIAALPIVSDAERLQITTRLGVGSRHTPEGRCWHEIFERRAALAPMAVALTCGDLSLSYGEIDRLSARAASRLSARNVGPDSVVALLSERTPELVIWMLAAHRAGGAYLPLDPNWPASRLAQALRSSAPVVLVSSAELESKAREALAGAGCDAPLIEMGDDGEGATGDGADEIRPQATVRNLAYIIYTSGSTGEPKGAMLTHAGLLNHLRAKVEDLSLSSSDVVAQTASQCFDISVWQMWAPLLVGGSIRLVPDEIAHDPSQLLIELDRSGVTVAELVPSVLGASFDHLEDAGAESHSMTALRWLLVTGETLPPELCRRWLTRYPSAPMMNAYGPTECSDDVTHEVISVAPAEQLRRIPIGRALRGIRLHVVDSRGALAPIGVSGELWCGGDGVGRGYVGRPDLTAERFAPDPFSVEAGARLYRTGDLARWLPDGRLEFLGRMDHQVKVRGFRIELAEIEAVLRRHEAVGDAAVVVRENPGAARLVAYVVGRGSETAPGAAELREWLGSELPSYMTPSAFVALDSLPLTSNGKLDRKALPEPEAVVECEQTAPRTSVEEILAGIWAETLRLERVGVEENFFELGGHSLLATQVITRVRQYFRVDLPLRALFESPTLAGLARRIEVARGARADAVALPALAPVAGRGAQSPLSFAQQRLWFLAQFEGVSDAYQIAGGVRLRGELDQRALRRALDRIVERHEVLRTTFSQVGGQPVQVIGPKGSGFLLREEDLRDSEDAECELRRLAEQEVTERFDLEEGPLIRGRLARLGEDEHALLLTMHHIVSDGWSIGILVDELSALYGAYCRGEGEPLKELAVQYADYAEWQRQWLRGAEWQRQAEYWKRELAGAPQALELPADRPRPAEQDYAGAVLEIELGEELTRKLKALSRRQGVTLYMTLLASWGALLGRLSGGEEVVIGTPVANRRLVEIEGLIGFFVNTLAIRVDLSGGPTVEELLLRVKERTMEGQEHQDFPFEQVVEMMQPLRSLSHAPVFQVMFAWGNTPKGELSLPGLAMTSLAAPHLTTHFDLSLSLQEKERQIVGVLAYATALFERETVSRYVGYWRRLLEGMVADEKQAVDRLPLLSDEERRQVLEEWNATEAECPREKCIHELFEEQVRRTPEAVAIVYEEQEISYRELNERANRLAHYLKELGVGPEVRVGIGVERSPEMVVALLATLKAGGAYVPLDPAYPPERLAYMLESSAPLVLLTHDNARAALAGLAPSIPILNLDSDATQWAGQSEQNPDHADAGPDARSLAYIIYTSGSTGTPKGVMVEHRGLRNMALAQQAFAADPESRVLQLASFSFDVCVFELTLALCRGALLVLPTRGAVLAGEALAQTVNRYEISHVGLSPTALSSLPQNASLDSVHMLIVGIEAVTREQVQRWAPGRRMINGYGPTETTIWTTKHECRAEDLGVPPIGGPIVNTRAYVLDGHLQPAPIGAADEIYIGGVGVARGYLNRPELTAERFLPDPFTQEPGARMYETGDLGRWAPDGNIEFLGRNDFQVKIRGFRVELGEIEAALREHPRVHKAVVLARQDSPGEKRLVAYLVSNRGAAPTPGEARAFLKERLPEYMVPSAFMPLDELPLSPNGKVDRRALPAPTHARPEGSAAHVAPRTPAEEVIAAIWSQVLGIENVGVYDNFFELGGHSLLVTRVVFRIREAFGIELPLRVIFESPVLAEFASSIELEIQAGSELDMIPLEPISRDQPIPLSLLQQEMLMREQMNPGTASNNVPILIRLSGELDLAALEWGLGELIRRHEILRTTFETSGGAACQIIHPPAPIQIPVVNITGTSISDREAYARRLAYEEGRRPFDLAVGPLVRAKVMRLSADEHLLLLVIHHIVIDPWSLSLFMRELTTLCGVFGQGEREAVAPLPDLPIQFADYAVWQRKWLQGEVLKRLQNYWRERLGGRLPSLNLPRKSKARRRSKMARGATCPIELPAVLSGRIKTLSLNEGATPFISLLAAFKATLYLYTGNTDIIVTSPMANRQRLEVEPLIGFFANSVALRTTFDEGASFRELLRNVRETALGAYMRQALPLDKILEALGEETDLRENPIGRVNFALLTFPVSQQEMGKLGSQIIDVEVDVAPSGLSLTLLETSEGFRGKFTYNADMFDEEFVLRVAERFLRLLQSVVSDPDQKLCDLNG